MFAVVGTGALIASFIISRSGPATLQRVNRQRLMERILQWGLAGSLLTGIWLITMMHGVMTQGWLHTKLLLFLVVAGLAGGMQGKTQRRRLEALQGGNADAATLAALQKRENVFFYIAVPAMLIILYLGIFQPHH